MVAFAQAPGAAHLLQVVLGCLQERLSGAEPALTLGHVQAQTLILEPGAHLLFTPPREGDVHGAGGDTCGDGWSIIGSDRPTRSRRTHLCLGSRDHPSRGPAVARTPPLLNSTSASSRFKEVE